MSLSKNTAKVRQAKMKLVKSFSKADFLVLFNLWLPKGVHKNSVVYITDLYYTSRKGCCVWLTDENQGKSLAPSRRLRNLSDSEMHKTPAGSPLSLHSNTFSDLTKVCQGTFYKISQKLSVVAPLSLCSNSF